MPGGNPLPSSGRRLTEEDQPQAGFPQVQLQDKVGGERCSVLPLCSQRPPREGKGKDTMVIFHLDIFST